MSASTDKFLDGINPTLSSDLFIERMARES
jgi:hypothetical protein